VEHDRIHDEINQKHDFTSSNQQLGPRPKRI
jgi:hypothetical protein